MAMFADKRDSGQPSKTPLKSKGQRPAGVRGRMKPRQLIDALEKARREHSAEEEEQSWKALEKTLRTDPV